MEGRKLTGNARLSGVVVCASSSRVENEEECASGSGFFGHVGNFSPVVLTTASWLMPLWAREEAREEDNHSRNDLEMWIRDNVSFSVIAQREGSKCTRPQSASLLACILLKNVKQTLLVAYPHSQYFDCRPTAALLPRRSSWRDRMTECLSSVLVVQVEPSCEPPWAVEGDGWPAL